MTGRSPSELLSAAQQAKDASVIMAQTSFSQRREAVCAAAERLIKDRDLILAANEEDLRRERDTDLTPAQIDRLTLNDARLESMATGLHDVSRLGNVVGEIADGHVLPNGLSVRRMRVPLGVIGIIYENRPNVTSDAAGLCLMAGNAVLLRGSSQAIASNSAIERALSEALKSVGLPSGAVTLVKDTTREGAVSFMQLNGFIDCLIPRGGSSLLQSVRRHASVPVVLDGDGNCHIFVDESADLSMARRIIANAKLQRPGVCNAMETLLVHGAIAEELLTTLGETLIDTEIRGDLRTCELIPSATPATDEDYQREFLDKILAVRVVDDLTGAIDHIRRYSSGHSEAIITESHSRAQRFISEVDAAAVLVNASTRFVDGGQLGLGAEIGISTQKLHARGPMGLEALTTLKYVIEGSGQIRS